MLVLFSRPDVLASAAAAAKADDDDALSDLIFEALRFRPINPMVVRGAKEDYSLAAGEQYRTLIRKGATVFALTWSATFDPRVLDTPEEFSGPIGLTTITCTSPPGSMDLLRKSGEFPVSNEELDETATTVYEGI
jgi:hypothetical protein